MTRNYVLCDIDHVLSNAFWRDDMIGVVGWDEYHAAAVDDEPISDMLQLISALSAAGKTCIGLTARPNKWRQLTTAWMLKHNGALDEILMREDEDFRPSPEMKTALALARFGGEEALRKNVMIVLDDRDDVTAAFRGLGLTCLQVHARRHG